MGKARVVIGLNRKLGLLGAVKVQRRVGRDRLAKKGPLRWRPLVEVEPVVLATLGIVPLIDRSSI